jgi:hypothetical protein
VTRHRGNEPQFDDPVVTAGNNPLAGKIVSASDCDSVRPNA